MTIHKSKGLEFPVCIVAGLSKEFAFRRFDTSGPMLIDSDWGVGIRLNLNFLVARIDMGMRLHDPQRERGDRWVGPRQWFPSNYALHFGVGYPF